ncbi:MAG: hypothetical protein JXA14_11735 [Anaerolineae bacterium]|jgi:hypothetical protein|nr:hypothetical protein [Anaerolineae bacterium]
MDNKELLKRALTDPKFRRTLETNPKEILGPKVTRADIASLNAALEKVKQIDATIEKLAGEVLCTNGGGCGLA